MLMSCLPRKASASAKTEKPAPDKQDLSGLSCPMRADSGYSDATKGRTLGHYVLAGFLTFLDGYKIGSVHAPVGGFEIIDRRGPLWKFPHF